ncbi:Tat pathway signal protein [Allostella humosa]|nr:Tat pathway signal protein [Stella humosa]
MLIGGATLAAFGGGAAWFAGRRMDQAADYATAVARWRAPLPDPAATRDLIRYATLAASGHNTQPWTFRVDGDAIRILPDLSRRTPVVDPDDHHLFVSLGCAAENLALASAARGRPGAIAFDAADGGSVVFSAGAGRAAASPLFDAIPARQSTRAEYDGRPVSPADLDRLAAAAAVPGVDLVLLADRARMERVCDLVVAGNGAQMADPGFLRELKAWLRFNPRQAMQAGDGLYSVASGNPTLPAWLGPHAFDWLVTAGSENDKYARQVRSSAGIAVFAGARANPAHWVAVGRACQRFQLQATAMGLRHAFINQPVEVPALRPELAALAGMRGKRPDIVLRFGQGPLLPYSPRRPVDAVIAGPPPSVA